MGAVANLKITWTSSRVLPNRIVGGGGKPDLSRLSSYGRAFDRAGGSSPWRAPWTADVSYSHLWETNLGGAYRNSTNWDKAWKRVVPLAAAGAQPLTTALPEVTLGCEQYLFPSGAAVMVVADIQGSLADSRVLEIAEEMGQRSCVKVHGRQAVPMTAVLGMLLNDVEVKVFRALDPESVASRRAQTIATVISTIGAPIGKLQQGSDTHRLLSGLSQLTSQISDQNIGDLGKDLLAAAANHRATDRVVIGAGRATWSPMQSSTSGGARKLECMHRNVSYSTMQVDLMLTTMRWAAGVGWRSLPQRAADILRPQLNLLGLMHGKTDVYTTRFVQRQIDDSELKPLISEFRVGLGVGKALT